MTASKTPRVPAAIEHLSVDMRGFYRKIVRTYQLDEHHRRLLVAACEAHDRMTAARDVIKDEGLTTTDRHGQTRPHPCISIERDSRIAFARLIREIGLQAGSDDSRPPRLGNRYEGRN